MPFLKHIVEPQLKKHLAKLQAELPPVPAPLPGELAKPALVAGTAEPQPSLFRQNIAVASQALPGDQARAYQQGVVKGSLAEHQRQVQAQAQQEIDAFRRSRGEDVPERSAPRPVAFLPAATGEVSEKSARAAVDKQRSAQRATDEGKTQISEALQRVLGVDRTNDIGPGGQSPIDRRNRIDALANKDTWTPEDLAVISDPDLAVARGARRFLMQNPPVAGTMQIPGDYAIVTDPLTGNKSVEMFTPELPAGQEVGGLRGLLMNDMRFQGSQRPGDAIRAGGYERPLPLQDALRGMSPGEAVGFLANQMRLDALEKQTGFRPTSI